MSFNNSWFAGQISTTIFKAYDNSGSYNDVDGVTCQISYIPRIVESCGLNFGYDSRTDLLSLQIILDGVIRNEHYDESGYDSYFNIGFSANEIVDAINSTDQIPNGKTMTLMKSESAGTANFSWLAFNQDTGTMCTDFMGYCTYLDLEEVNGDLLINFSRVYSSTDFSYGRWALSMFLPCMHVQIEFLLRVTIE